jgi:hypothetical protein
MKATIEFKLPEDEDAHLDALKGSDWKFAMDDLLNYLRTQIKHGDNSVEEYRTFERVRERVSDILEERGLRIH